MSAPAADLYPSPPGGFAPAPVPSTRRAVESILLVLAVVITGAALVIVDISQQQQLGSDIVADTVVFAVLMALAHLAIRRFARHADPLLLPIAAVLNGLGIVLIHRLDLSDRQEAIADSEPIPTADAHHQLLWSAAAVVLFGLVLGFLRDYRTLARYGYTLGFTGLVLLLIPAILPNSEINGARLWIRLPGFTLQPGEFAKILLIVFFASVLVAQRELFTTAGRRILGMEFPRARDLGPILIVWAVSICVLAFETDLGMSLLVFATVLVMLYIATERVGWLVIGVVLLVVGYACADRLLSHVHTRTEAWLDPFAHYNSSGYQISQSLFGLATGGLAGTGLGSGRPGQVPFAKTDFIVATVGEELGLIGLTALLMLYLVFVARGLRTALAIRDSFGKLLAAGLAATIAIQVFVVVGGVTKLIPETGITTPFLSYGGSSLLSNYVLLALLVKVSDAARSPAPAKKREPTPTPIADVRTELVRKPK